MLVVLSDVHLTDPSAGTEIDPKAFRKFCSLLDNIIGDLTKTNIRQVEIVLLGDIFDVIRSDTWLLPQNNHPTRPIRPWSASGEADSAGWNVERYVKEIVDKIIANERNQRAISYLTSFQQKWADQGVKVMLDYFIGNHDWLINRYDYIRQDIADFLGMTDSLFFKSNQFYPAMLFDRYGVFARHGDIYDPLNYEGDRNASSLGDAIVTDLLNKFPDEVKNDPDLAGQSGLIALLKEIDNVRPLLQIPAWVQGVCRRYPGTEDKVHKIWNGLVDKFIRLDFVQAHDRWGPDIVDGLEAALRLTKDFSFARLQDFINNWMVRGFLNGPDKYREFAQKDSAIYKARYVVYGHTHEAQQVPLGIAPGPGDGATEILYFNTGTWRKVFEHTVFNPEKLEFIGWYVLTFLVFYLPEEKGERNYEMWSASLGTENPS
jgi:UDP-2,3-diacylglucosamine pyrophosphatase LpxH